MIISLIFDRLSLAEKDTFTFALCHLDDGAVREILGAVLSILTVRLAGQVVVLPALSFTVPGTSCCRICIA